MSERIRVVHLVVAGSIGGAERFLVDLASRPEASDATHSVALLSHDDRLPTFFKQAGLRVHHGGCVAQNPVNYVRTTFGRRELGWLTGVLEGERAQVLHVHTFGSHLLGARAATRSGVPALRTEHHIYHYQYPSMSPFTRWAARGTSRFVAVSDYVRREVSRLAPSTASRMVTVRNGVDANHFAFAPIDTRTRVDQPVVFASVCRLDRWKGVDLAIEGLAAVPGAILQIAGTGPDRERLEAIARDAGVAERVEFLGHLSDVRPVIKAADVAVSGSDHEPLGLSVLEALATGRPVIAFAGGGIPEVVEDGETGWLVEERTGQAYGAAMREAASNRERLVSMGDAARSFAERECTIETMCAGYAKAYRDTLQFSL